MLYRIFPFDPSADEGEPGHASFAPRSNYGRVDNADRYRVLYCSSDPAGAVAEAFGRYPVWDADTLRRVDGRGYAIARFTTQAERVIDLDDAATLAAHDLRPSNVFTRNRDVTQAWALRLFDAGIFDGVAWWSYYKPEWSSVGIWNQSVLRLAAIERLSLRHEAVVEAAREIVRIVRRD